MPPARPRHQDESFEVEFGTDEVKLRKPPARTNTGPIDLDEIFADDTVDDDSVFGELDGETVVAHDEEERLLHEGAGPRYFSNPNRKLFDSDAHLIPGSPFSKPANRVSNRPAEPLALAKYASSLGFIATIVLIGYLLFAAIWFYDNVGRIIVECILALVSFFGLFWNAYFISASFFKCFIPRKAFLTNTKYCSIIPEQKYEGAKWMEVTIQIPVYKESLKEVLMPTLQSCMKAREHYTIQTGGTRCNIVVCDDGIMALLRDNFAAAGMVWESIVETEGKIMKLSQLLSRVPRASRRHLKGLRSKDVYEVFHRMLFYYHFHIGWVARSTVDRRGKFKKASNLNSHLRLAMGAAQLSEEESISFEEALHHESHNEDGSRYVMYGNDVRLGDLICINDADARMAETVIFKTVPEFLNDDTLGFTQHATKTMNDQRGESYFTNMLTVYTDALYQGHFLLSSIMGCHPPLVGHSIFLRTDAVQQIGRMRTLKKAQRWLRNIGLPFLPVDQIGFSNLQADNRTEFWSESHVSEDFELMIHFYNLGFNGRYINYPDCEFQEGITRTFDEEAGRHRKFALGAHELVFNPFNEFIGHGIFTPMFKVFLQSDIPSYYKVFLTAYLCSYTSGGTYIIVFTASAIARMLDSQDSTTLMAFSPAGVIILNFVIYYIFGYFTFIISILRMHFINNKLLFPEYRKKIGGACYLVFVMVRYCVTFQFLFYAVATFTYYFLGSMDHLLSRPNAVGATNKDAISSSRCFAIYETIKFNLGSYLIATVIAGLGYLTVLQDEDWDPTVIPKNIVEHALFAGPPVVLALMAYFVPLLLNPYVFGWPCVRAKPEPKKRQKTKKYVKRDKNGNVVDIRTFLDNAEVLQREMERTSGKPDVELGSMATKDLYSSGSPMSPSNKKRLDKKSLDAMNAANAVDNWKNTGSLRMTSIPENANTLSSHRASAPPSTMVAAPSTKAAATTSLSSQRRQSSDMNPRYNI